MGAVTAEHSADVASSADMASAADMASSAGVAGATDVARAAHVANAGNGASTARRRRGRPPKGSAGPPTVERLLDAAASACTELGFDGATIGDIARRAGVTPTAIYNHFPSRSELLVTAARRALEGVGVPAGERDHDVVEFARRTARRFLAPDQEATRRLIAELHVAAQRHPDLADLLAVWHQERAKRLAVRLDGPPAVRQATAKAFFLVLLGTCHLEALAGLPAPAAATTEAVERAVAVAIDHRGAAA
jgi:AcrR family transcriptional regulator